MIQPTTPTVWLDFLFCNHIPEVIRVTVSALTLSRRMRILSDLRGEGSEQPRTLSLRNGVFLLRQRSKDLLGSTGELPNLWELNTLRHLVWGYSVGASRRSFRRQFSEAAGVGFIAVETIRDKGTNREKRPRRSFSFPRGVFGLARWDSRW